MTAGFGDFDTACPKAPDGGHVWTPPDRRLMDRRIPANDTRTCVHCGVKATAFMDGATKARTELFSSLRQPRSAHGSVKKS